MDIKILDSTENENPAKKTPPKTDPALSSAKDRGLFLPSACVSPSSAVNKNFTFGPGPTNIPRMKASLNC